MQKLRASVHKTATSFDRRIMCGIFGYIGFRKASGILLRGLKRLEYRGYDSCGMATISKNLVVKKGAGKIDEVNKRLNFTEMGGHIGIAHTRWATHGKVNDINAHPHVDCSGKISVVHNGIIENYQELRNELQRKGHKFISETDTEVIAHLVEEFSKTCSFEEACKKAFKKLKGSFACLIIKEGEEKIIAIRKDSPLVLGVGENEIFISSDIPALLEFTKKVVYLSNWDFVVAEKGKFKIENLEKGPVERRIEVITTEISEIEKGEYPHYMLKEILEQIKTIKRSIEQPFDKVNEFVEAIKRSKKVYLIGAGTSYHACLAGSYFFSKMGIPATAILASEFPHFIDSISKDDLIIAVSQSGETADVLEAVRLAKGKGIKVYSVVNVPNSSLTRECDRYLLINAGIEIGVAATKTYTSQLSLLALLAYSVNGNYKDAIKLIEKAANIAYDLTAKSTRDFIRKVAEKLAKREHIFLIGRGLDYVTALEGALKIKEISYIHAEAFAGGEIKHGTIALIEEGTPCIVFVSRDVKDEILSNAIELKSRGGFIVGVSPEWNDVFDIWIKVPECYPLDCIIQVIPMQLLAYELAVLRGFDPDKPRNLAKSVTVK